MTVFKAFWQVVNKYKGTIAMYTIMLLIFGGMNMATNDTGTTFVETKPDILIVNHDKEEGITKNLIDYLENSANIVSVFDSEDARDDALFYRDVNYIIYIPEGYREAVMNGINPTIEIKSTGDYQASLAEMMLTKYLEIQNIYLQSIENEDALVDAINQNLDKKVTVTMTSKIDTSTMAKISMYFNFASYSIMAVIIYIVCLVLMSFHEKSVNKRIIISSMNYQQHNRKILYASFVYTTIVWLLYVLLGIILFGSAMFSVRGLLYMANTFIFTFCSLTVALFISTLVKDKNAISGIVNVIALGSAFLCGAFVPAQWLPKNVLAVAHLLPAYWYINTNDLLATIEIINYETLKPLLFNMIVTLLCALFFIVINNIASKRKQKIG